MPVSYSFTAVQKAEMLATLKIAFDGGQNSKYRRDRVLKAGEVRVWEDTNPSWGLLKLPDVSVLISEIQNYKLDDDKIRTDSVMTLAMLIHYIEMRRPKVVRRSAVDMDFYNNV
jgi:hypothetical protein